MTIKHLVLSAGSYKGLHMLGALKYLEEIEYFSNNNIETVYAVSIGSLIGVLLAMKLELDDIIEYTINRPWEKLFNLTTDSFLNCVYSKGILNINIFYSVFENFFKKKKISKKITMIEFYNTFNVALNFITLNINTFKTEVLSHVNTPNLPIIEAVYMSCALPFVFEPFEYKNNLYIDGGLVNPYPLKLCMEKHEDEEILSFFIKDQNKQSNVCPNDNIFKYGFFIFNNLMKKNRIDYIVEDFPNEILILADEINMGDAMDSIGNIESRKKNINLGKNYAKLFIKYKNNK
jgi:predicted acylesterase/phospholipase RssA